MSLITTYLYQPFYNLLVLYYTGMEYLGFIPDMGIAVILMTLSIRVLLLPLSIASTRTKRERHEIEQAVKQAKEAHSAPIAKRKIKKIFRSNRRILISEAANFFVQMGIFFILYRIFTTGLEGKDVLLIYDSVPQPSLPFNMMFLGSIDLSKPSFMLNLVQSITILCVEIVNLIDTPFPVSRAEFVRYIIVLPIASFIFFAFLPSGKKLFIITTLWFSFFFILSNIIFRQVSQLFDRYDQSVQKRLESES